jgi:glycosyltransferase involved in cell wall biosynthesis
MRTISNAIASSLDLEMGKTMSGVSILSPTYQHAAFISDCIRSVLAQTVQDWEMIIVDDGSDDGTPDIAESFDDPRIKVIRRQHEGVAGIGRSYAAALAHSTAPFVAILECDDSWPDNKLEVQLPLFSDPDVVLTHGSAGLIDEFGCTYAHFRHAPRGKVGKNDPPGIIIPALVDLNFIVAVTVMLRRSALEEIGGFIQPSGIPYVDHPTWLAMATKGTFGRSPLVLGNWRRHAQQITTRSWFDNVPDRTSYLSDFAEGIRDVVTPEVLSALVALSRDDQTRRRQEAAIAEGRVALLGGRWRHAASTFRQLTRTGEPLTRAIAAVGLLCATCRTDMEWLISAAGRHSLPSRHHLASHGLQ